MAVFPISFSSYLLVFWLSILFRDYAFILFSYFQVIMAFIVFFDFYTN